MDKEFAEKLKKYPNGDLYHEYDYKFYVIEKALRKKFNYTGCNWTINAGFDDKEYAVNHLNKLKKIHSKDHRARKVIIAPDLKEYGLKPYWLAYWDWKEEDEID